MRKVLYSPAYGAGWSSWHSGGREELEFMLFHPGLVEAVEAGEDLGYLENRSSYDMRHRVKSNSPLHGFVREWIERFGDGNIPYLGGAKDLQVETVEGAFRIEEYDGYESVRTSPEEWF